MRSLEAVKTFRSKSVGAVGYIVQISVDNLAVDIIDLRTQENRDNYYTSKNSKEDINKFNNYAKFFQEVLLVGYVPANHIQLVT
jgi:ribosomal protein L33